MHAGQHGTGNQSQEQDIGSIGSDRVDRIDWIGSQIRFGFGSDSVQDSVQIRSGFGSDSVQIRFRFNSDSIQTDPIDPIRSDPIDPIRFDPIDPIRSDPSDPIRWIRILAPVTGCCAVLPCVHPVTGTGNQSQAQATSHNVDPIQSIRSDPIRSNRSDPIRSDSISFPEVTYKAVRVLCSDNALL